MNPNKSIHELWEHHKEWLLADPLYRINHPAYRQFVDNLSDRDLTILLWFAIGTALVMVTIPLLGMWIVWKALLNVMGY